ncbi:tyrosine decarboxylase 1-like protein [Tanacetum coccineum]
MVLRSYGETGLREVIRKHVKMAKDFEELVTLDKRFELIVPRYFSVVCFRVSPYVIGKKYNEKLLESVNATGCAYMTHSVVGGVYFIRFAVGATLTEDRHVAMAWELVKNQATSMLYVEAISAPLLEDTRPSNAEHNPPNQRDTRLDSALGVYQLFSFKSSTSPGSLDCPYTILFLFLSDFMPPNLLLLEILFPLMPLPFVAVLLLKM